jgi:transcriptional regulator with XRE-family HTH domain
MLASTMEYPMDEKKNSSLNKHKLQLVLGKLMADAQITYIELAKDLNMATSVIAQLLNSDEPSPRINTLIKISKYFKITVSQLIGEASLEAKYPVLVALDEGVIKENIYWNPSLFIDATNIVVQFIKDNNIKEINSEVVIPIVKEIYSYSARKRLNEIDKDFSNWYLNFIKKQI